VRPRGEIRAALAEATHELVRESGRGVTWAEAACRAQVGADVARRTMDNMARSGELQRLEERVRWPGVRRPMTLFVPVAPALAVEEPDDEVPPLAVLDDVLRGRFPPNG
jgi:hypothetical protein